MYHCALLSIIPLEDDGSTFVLQLESHISKEQLSDIIGGYPFEAIFMDEELIKKKRVEHLIMLKNMGVPVDHLLPDEIAT